ncbi:MAG: metal-dependent hydrolase [Candidatus Riflebacteria bacterium]|nr:metal-dependent hydrolase [Candidatus Riflebacteria bacterium]
MKGLTHFISGIAVASFFPQAVHMASQEQSFILCLGGVFGILPDTLDFKFARYFYKSEFEVWPDPNKLDAMQIASTVAASIERANSVGSSSVQLHTMQLGANLWRSYTLWFDSANSEVVVEMGPIVDTGQTPFIGTEPKENAIAKVKVNCPFFQPFDKKSNISIMSGPCFEFLKRDDGRIEIVFLPWHRTWSHSLTLGLLCSLIVGIFSYFFVSPGLHSELYTIPRWMLYPLIVFFGSCVHLLEDSTGFMGNNLLYPFTKNRTRGLGWVSAAEGIPNFFCIWVSIIMILFNLDRFRWSPDLNPTGIGQPWVFFFWFLFIPVGIMIFLYYKYSKEKEKSKGESDFDSPSSNDRDTEISSG